MSKDKDKFREQSKYTLDDILAEYDENQKIDASPENEKAIEDKNISPDKIHDTSNDVIELTDEDDNIEQVFDTPTNNDSVISDVFAVPTFENTDSDSVNVVLETDIDTPFVTPELSDEDIEEIEAAISNFSANTPAEFTAQTAENIADSVSIFKETLEDEDVSEELANLPPEDSDEIYADEEDDDTSEEILEVSQEFTEDNSDEDVNIVWWKKVAKSLFPMKNDGIGEIIRKVVFLCATVVFIGAGVMLTSTLIQSRRAVKDLDELRSMVSTTVATSIDEQGNTVTIAPTQEDVIEHNYNLMQSLQERFENIIAFIEMPACDIAYPVVQTDNNDYYLDHTYYDAVNKAGAIFLDYRATLTTDYTSPNLVLYGHNQSDGTMFGNLKYFKKDSHDNIDFYKNNPEVTLRTIDGIDEYVIYAFFITNALPSQDSNGEVFHYHDFIETLKTKDTFEWYMNEILNRSQIISPVDIQFGDELLLLSTCSNEFSDSRFVVCARKLRDGEKISDFDFASTKVNYNAKKLDWFAITSNETTEEVTEVLTLRPRDTTTLDEDGDEDGETSLDDEEPSVTTVPPSDDENGETVSTKKTKKTTAENTDNDSPEESTPKYSMQTTATNRTPVIFTPAEEEETEVTTVPLEEQSTDDNVTDSLTDDTTN